MSERTMLDRYMRTRSKWRRLMRLIFPSPAETRFVELMGGRVLRIGFIKRQRSKFPMTIIYKQPRVFKNERVRREVRCGRYYVDFGNDIGRGIEIDGADFHRDIVAEFERDSYFYQRDWRVMRIEAYRLYQQPDIVQRDVLKFLSA